MSRIDTDTILAKLERLRATTQENADAILELLTFIRESPEILEHQGVYLSLLKTTNDKMAETFARAVQLQRQANAGFKELRRRSAERTRDALEQITKRADG